MIVPNCKIKCKRRVADYPFFGILRRHPDIRTITAVIVDICGPGKSYGKLAVDKSVGPISQNL
jgi:hypothetical protein